MSETAAFVAVRIQGGLLTADLVSRLATGHDLDGMSSGDYHLAAGESVREAANRVWAYLRGVWTAYREALERLPGSDRATTLTRERWSLILLDQLGYGRVPLTGAGGLVADGRAFPVSHVWQSVPIHLLGARVDLDRRTPGLAGAAGASPQSLVQELLNHSDRHLWAILSNGRTLRLLRDSTSLVGSAYVEFDLEAIFDGDLFADFLLLYTLCHQSRVEVGDEEQGPWSCWLETWRQTALESGTRALDQLRYGVLAALRTLGAGFLGHPHNAELRVNVEKGTWSIEDIHHGLLRVVYRLLFTFVAEDRGALLDPAAPPKARMRYHEFFSTARLRQVARRRSGGRHGDRWRSLCLVWEGLGSPAGRPELGIVGIGGLFEPGELDVLTRYELSNEALLSAVRSLSLVREPRSGFQRVVDHRNLGAEELGSIYESLLEYVPRWDGAAKQYHLDLASGNVRKTSGSYYTPTSLIDCLLDSALDPVLDDAEKNAADPEAALLGITVCDPACGSGHFLVAAARRIAKRVAGLRTGDPEPAPEAVRSALRDVVGRCIYGVDINPLAAELAKVSLWLEALDPGLPLAFLDAQVKVGNALIGATPALLAEGIPDAAYKPIEGDDKRYAAELAKQNKRERSGQDSLFEVAGPSEAAELSEWAQALVGKQALSLADVHVQQQRLRSYVASAAYSGAREVADGWCAAFVWPKRANAPKAVTHQVLVDLAEQPERVLAEIREEIARLAAEYRFFHWHLEFPHIFSGSGAGAETNPVTGWRGGFDVVLGNPPWERVKLQEQEFFASKDPEVALAPNAAVRKRLIQRLVESNPSLYADYLAALRRAEGESHLLRNSGRYPLAGRGDVNTYAVFAEADRMLLSVSGRLGVVLPTGIATDATTQFFFSNLVSSRCLVSLYSFREIRRIFIGTDDRKPFCLLTVAGSSQDFEIALAFGLSSTMDLNRVGITYSLTPAEIRLLNPNTGTCPVFRSRRDAELTLGIYRRVPVLINENDPVNGNPWGIKFMRMFDMSNAAHLFHTRDGLEGDGWTLHGNVFKRGDAEMLPLYEAKMIHQYDHRWATYERDGTIRDVTIAEKQDPAFVVMPRYWVARTEVVRQLDGKWSEDWLLGWRRVARSTDERTLIVDRLPIVAIPDKLALVMPRSGEPTALQANMSSFCLDYVARQKAGGIQLDMYLVKQLPVLKPIDLQTASPWDPSVPLESWMASRVHVLNSTAWNRGERAQTRAQLDAAFFHLYAIGREDVDYIMETFPIVKRKDMTAYGEHRTKRMILEIYDAMAEAIRTGVPYESN